DQILQPTNKIQAIIHQLWCDLLEQQQISIDTNIFTIGGHSLILMQLLYRYKSRFHLETNSLSIRELLQSPTILNHAQLIQQTMNNTTQNINNNIWSSLYLTKAQASFVQERVILDEQIRFSSKIATKNLYIIPLLYRISSVESHASISRLRRTLLAVVRAHPILCTAVDFNTNDKLMQYRSDIDDNIDDHQSFGFTITELHNDNELDDKIEEIMRDSDLFDLAKGRVMHFHIIRQHHRHHLTSQNDDLLTSGDLLMICLHHSAIDGYSIPLLLHDLSNAYRNDCSLPMNENTLQYIDYSVHERLIDMTASRKFWHSQLEGYNFERRLPLPFDRCRLSTEHHSTAGVTNEIIFDDADTTTEFLTFASVHQVTLYQLALATFYAFLFKLIHGESDICIASLDANRYKPELQNMIGMFVATLPYRVQVDSQWSFKELVKHVQQKYTSICEHTHYPLQDILADFHHNQLNTSFLRTFFEFNTEKGELDQLNLLDTSLEKVSLPISSFQSALFDFEVIFLYDSALNSGKLSCLVNFSLDCFNETTIKTITKRFEHFYSQLFTINSNSITTNAYLSPIRELSAILPEELKEIQGAMFHRLSGITNKAPISYAQTRLLLNRQRHFHPDHLYAGIFNLPYTYRCSSSDTLSIIQLQKSLQQLVYKHQSLRTSLVFDTESNILTQQIIDMNNNDNNKLFAFVESIFEANEELNQIIYNEKYNSELFNLSQGQVFRCRAVYYKQIPTNFLISDKDIIIFNFHPAFFDLQSMNIFLHDLNRAYFTNELSCDDDNNLRYLDYAITERQMPMTDASMFWLDTLHGYNLDQSLSLPFDRCLLPNEHRTYRGIYVSFDFNKDLSNHFINYSSSNGIMPINVALTIYYIFLFKLTNRERDLCIGMNTDIRWKEELKTVIGLFENIIPLRCKLNPHWSLHQLITYVQEMITNSLEYSYFPLQRILHKNLHISKCSFLDIFFNFRVNENKTMIRDVQHCVVPVSYQINTDEIMTDFKFGVDIYHDPNI
ncbi:unnamed protein product, partial [Adineta ricciae]